MRLLTNQPRDIEQAIREPKDQPLRLAPYATAALPAAADWPHGLAHDTTTNRLALSDGTAWLGLQPYDATLAALGALDGTAGVLVQTGADTFAKRTLAAPAAGFTITNPAGTAGNPTFVLANDLAALEALTGTNTIYYRSAADTWTAVTISAPLGFSGGALSVTGTLAVGNGGTGAGTASGARTNLRSGAMVKKAADQTAADYTVATAIAWDSEAYDDAAWHDNATNNSRLTVPAGLGIDRVRVGGSVRMANVTTGGTITLSLIKNGSSSFDGAVSDQRSIIAADPRTYVIAGPMVVTAGDYFELQLTVSGDASVDMPAARSNFWIEAC